MTLDVASMPPAPSLRELADRCFDGIERHIALGGQLTDDQLAQLQMVLGPNLAKALQLVDAAAAAAAAASEAAAAARQQQQQQQQEQPTEGDQAAAAPPPPPPSPPWLPPNPVKRVRAAQSGREAFWVSAGSGGGGGGPGGSSGRPGSGSAQHYVTLPRLYCSCHSYHFEVATRSVATFCKHQIAARLCAALGYCSDQPDVPDATLAAMLLYG